MVTVMTRRMLATYLLRWLVAFHATWGLFMLAGTAVPYNLLTVNAVLIFGSVALLFLFNSTRRVVLNVATVLIAQAVLVTLASELDLSYTLPDLARRFIPLALFVIVAHGQFRFSDRLLRFYSLLIVWVSLPVQALFFSNYLGGVIYLKSFQYGYLRYAAPFEGPHTAAYFFCVTIFALVYLLMEHRHGHWLRSLMLLDIFHNFYLVYLTGTRTAIIGVFIFFLALLVFGRRSRSKLFYAAVVLIAAYIGYLSLQLFQDTSMFLAGNLPAEKLGSGRLFMWRISLDRYLHFGTLGRIFGGGIGGDRFINVGGGVIGSHNDYITLLIELGLAGFLLYLGTALAAWLRLRRLKADFPVQVQWLKALIVSCLSTNLFSNAYYARPYPATYFWIATALVLTLRRPSGPSAEELAHRETAEPPPLQRIQQLVQAD